MRDHLDRIAWTGVLSILLAFLFVLLTGCATAPPVRVMVPHICGPGRGSVAFQNCQADCPNGEAVLWENASDTQCICRKAPEGT